MLLLLLMALYDQELISQVPLLRKASPHCLQLLVPHLKRCYADPGSDIVKAGDIG